MLITRAIHLFETLMLIENFLAETAFNSMTFLSRLQSVIALAQRGSTEGERDASREAVKRMLARAKQEAGKMAKTEARWFENRVEQLIASMDRPQAEPVFRAKSRPSPSPPPQPQSPKPAFKVGDWVTWSRPKGKLTGKVISVNEPWNTSPMWRYHVRIAGHESGPVLNGFQIQRATQDEIDAALARGANPQDRASSSKPRAEADDTASQDNKGEWAINKIARFTEGTSNKVYGIAFKSNPSAYGRDQPKIVTFWGRYDGPLAVKDYSAAKSGLLDALAVFRSKLAKGYQEVSLTPQQKSRMLALLRDARGLP